MGYLTPDEARALGLADLGEDVQISDTARIYGAGAIKIGDRVRIDDYAVITADEPVSLGAYVHIATGVYLNGTAGVSIGDFTSLSARVCLYTNTDDFSGPAIIGATVPREFRNVKTKRVDVGRHCVVGAGSVVLPGAELPEGVAVGALSLVKERLEAWTLYAGVPARKVRARSKEALELERELRKRDG
jgi:acetyltransferase-like isoleucine patch superfamily enzyme